MLAYFDTYSGASGDMILGALLDAGLELQTLRDALSSLPLDGYTLEARPVKKGALGATAFRVVTAAGQPARRLSDILALIAHAGLPGEVEEQAKKVFTMLGKAEARVHRVAIDDVHFHEVGALDAIIDIVGACLALHLLGITRVCASPLPVARGSRPTAHGLLPMPGPATLEIMAAVGAPAVTPPSDTTAELVTPTGAALLCSLATFEQPALALRRVGYGAGDAELAHPNVLRVWVGEPLPPASVTTTLEEREPVLAEGSEYVTLLETNIDDMNPQVYGHLFDRFLDAGALDVWCAPVTMKKGRPATVLAVLCRPADGSRFQDMLLRETTTLGVRVQNVQRATAERAVCAVETLLGPIRVKAKHLNGRLVATTPEYEDCLALAREHNLPLIDVLAVAAHAVAALDDGGRP